MRLTTRGRYAVTAMLDLALHQSERAVTLRDIAENQKISLSYLEQLFAKLRDNKLVEGVRGPGGGYRLAQDVETISIAQIIAAVDEPMHFTECGGNENCRDGEKCLSHHLWETLTDQLDSFLSNIYLGAMMRESAEYAQRAKANRAVQHVALPN